MHIAVAGASGGTGRHVVQQAVAAGHRVTALVRSPARYDPPQGVEVVTADVVTDPRPEIPEDADAVVSALGRGSMPRNDPESTCLLGVVHLLAAMHQRGIRRLAAISAAPVLTSGEGTGMLDHLVIGPLLRAWGKHIYPDLHRMETYLHQRNADCDWTVIRPGYLVDGEEPGPYQLLPDRNAPGVSRRPDLAAALLTVLDAPATQHRAYGFGSRKAPVMDDAAWHGSV